jgi:Domain of unknown function (DU1801)
VAELKTQRNDSSVAAFIDAVEDETKRQDCRKLLEIFKQCTGEEPAMWGTSIVGYGSYHYKSERSSQEGDWMMTGFSPRKQTLTIYIMPGFDKYQELLAKLGKHTSSVSCLYIKKLADVDLKILEKIIKNGYLEMKKTHG